MGVRWHSAISIKCRLSWLQTAQPRERRTGRTVLSVSMFTSVVLGAATNTYGQPSDRADANAVSRSNGSDGLTRRTLGLDGADHGKVIANGCWTPKARSFSLDSCETGHDALSDHGSLKLGEHAHHLEHGPTGRSRGV